MKNPIFIQCAKFLSSHQKVLRTLFFRCIQLVKLFQCLVVTFLFFLLAALGLRCFQAGFLQLQRMGATLLWCLGFSLRWPLFLQSTGSVCTGFSGCSTWAPQLQLPGSRAKAQQLLHTGLVLCDVWSFQTHVPCIGRWILIHCTTREVQQSSSSWCLEATHLESEGSLSSSFRDLGWGQGRRDMK